ncbi:hypothetical protein GF406_08055 [candidate division KSB1 bacterium]|nr:hypothetical protein [candidate division KSB1 bacterium]
MSSQKHLFLILIVLLSVVPLFGGAIINEFSGEAGHNRVELKWVVKTQVNVKGYELYRSLDGTNFERLKFVQANYDKDTDIVYTYTDTKVFKSTGHTFHYKLKIVDNDGTVIDYDKTLTLSPHISSARQTWGSLKAMFR